jgi:signal transduction histidine kinase
MTAPWNSAISRPYGRESGSVPHWIEDAKGNADAMRAIRDLAMGLRPSMLDDIGIEAARQWQGREFSRPESPRRSRRGSLIISSMRTRIYRVVEALTNCRHAKAKRRSLRAREHGVSNWVGLEPQQPADLGLLGMRSVELDGKVAITSNPGTTIRVELPAGVLREENPILIADDHGICKVYGYSWSRTTTASLKQPMAGSRAAR